MALRAIAFHESISTEKLEKLFRSEWNQLFAATTFAHCPTCKVLYAVYLPNTDDKNNLDYLGDLEKEIAKDCSKGKHSLQEIRLDRTP